MEDTKAAWERKAPAWIRCVANTNSNYTQLSGFVAELAKRHMQGGKTLDIGCGAVYVACRRTWLGYIHHLLRCKAVPQYESRGFRQTSTAHEEALL